MGARVLIVEDEADFLTLIANRCRSAGYEVGTCTNGTEALARILNERWDVVLLDLGLPGSDGFLVCQELRSLGNTTPILMSTARREVADRIAGLRCGADDYLAKPYDMLELLARIEALLRRSAIAAEMKEPRAYGERGTLAIGDCSLDALRQCLTTPRDSYRLGAIEYRLLLLLAGDPGRIWSRQELLDLVWGCDAMVSDRTVDVHMASLRKYLKDSERLSLNARRNQGYCLVVEPR